MNSIDERSVVDRFLDHPGEDTFAALFQTFSPQLVAFFRRRGREAGLAEDFAQEVMLTVYRKAGQIRDRALFRAWLFKVARNAASRHFARLTHEVPTVDWECVNGRFAPVTYHAAGGPGFEFHGWMTVLEPRERAVMTMRFVEDLEYHEIAAVQAIPIGTVQWQVFNSKKKLAAHLNRWQGPASQAA